MLQSRFSHLTLFYSRNLQVRWVLYRINSKRDLKAMSTPCEPPNNEDIKAPAVVAAPGRGPMRMPRRQRWVPNGILAKVDEVVVPVKPPALYQVISADFGHYYFFVACSDLRQSYLSKVVVNSFVLCECLNNSSHA